MTRIGSGPSMNGGSRHRRSRAGQQAGFGRVRRVEQQADRRRPG
jgi:hypothetical protein